jgi:hypothetical protein
MKKILLAILLLPCFGFAQTIDLNEIGINGTMDTKGYFTETPRLKKNTYGKFVEYKIYLGENTMELMPTSKAASGTKMMAEVSKMATTKIKGKKIKIINKTSTSAIMVIEEEGGTTTYKCCAIIKSKNKEFFMMGSADKTQEDAEHLIEVAKSFVMK